MAISKERMGGILAPFVLLFGANDILSTHLDDAAELWASLLRNFNEDELIAAVRPLALKLKRFPVPADFVEQIEAARNAEEATHG